MTVVEFVSPQNESGTPTAMVLNCTECGYFSIEPGLKSLFKVFVAFLNMILIYVKM